MRKKGFTLIEMIVVLTIVVITALIAVPSLFNYLARAEQLTRTDTAKLIYLTAQNQLTQIRALGNLKSAYGAEISGKYFETDLAGDYTDELDPALTDTNNVYNLLTDVNYPAPDLENGQDNYVRYLSKPAGEDLDHPVTQLLMPGIRDSEILEGTILIEYNILTGKILSVFYTDDERVSEFSYTATADSTSDIMGPRAELYDDIAIEREQGYYGVDYTGEVAPDKTFQISINIYDGYDDGQDDTAILPGISQFNKNLIGGTVNDRNDGAALENILYAEIFIEKALLEATPTPTFDLSLSGYGSLIADDIVLSNYATNETLEDALEAFDDGSRDILIYRNDSLTGDPDFARFIWVLDYVGGDMSGENDERYKYSIANLVDIDGNTLDLNGVSEITATIVDSSNPAALPVQSNPKHPLFADESNLAVSANPTAYITTSRHLSNIRHIDDDADYTYSQIADIDFAHDNGFIEIAGDFANSGTDEEWNLKMSPIPPLLGSYTGLYTEGTNTGVRTIQNLFVFDVNFDTDPADYTEFPADAINRSVGLFEAITTTGEVSRLTFINPYVEVKNTPAYYPGSNPDDGKYAGVVTGFSNGGISHITISSDSDVAPIYDLDNGTNSEADYGRSEGDFIGGVVGLVGDSVSENAINHILYLAVAPYEEKGSAYSNRVRYDYPIIGENLSGNDTIEENVARAIDENSCYYLVGDAVRPTSYTLTPQVGNTTDPTSTTNLNSNTLTYGYGKAISTNDIYTDMQNPDSDFYKNFMVASDGTTRLYNFDTTVTDPGDGTTVSSLQYPYPYYGNILPNNDSIDTGSIVRDMNFAWPVATLEPFEAEFIYYEIYGNELASTSPEIGIYQIDSTGNIVVNTLKDITVDSPYRILSDGYGINVNRPYSMLNPNDITFTVNGVTISAASTTSWLNYYNENLRYDEFTDRFKSDPTSTDIESFVAISNSTFSSAVSNATYNDTTDVLALQLSDGRGTPETWYINPLFAKAIYTEDATDAAAMVYSVRSARHLNNIGYYANSESVNSNFYQEIDINLANFGAVISPYPTTWSYTIANPWYTYNCLKYGGNSGSWSNLHNAGSVSAITYPFEGDYNGNGKTIENLSKSAVTSHVGLFEVIGENGNVYDLNITNFNMTSQGLTISGVFAAENRGTISNITITNSTVLGTFWNYGTGTNRPSEVGGVVARNSGTIENAVVENTTIIRHEVGSALTYGKRSHGVGGIAGNNSGEVLNSAVINTTITAYDNFIGGIVGVALDGSVIDNNLVVYNGVDDAGNPVSPVSYDPAAEALLTSENPRYSIGGIVGGIVHDEFIASGVYVDNEGVINDNIYLALAPGMDTTSDDVVDTIYPIFGSFNGGFTSSSNVFLKGLSYSDDNITYMPFDYNSLDIGGAPTGVEVIGYESTLLNLRFLAGGTNISHENWFNQASNDYPVPIDGLEIANVPYARNRARQHTEFEGDGVATIDNVMSVEMLFNGERNNVVAAGSDVAVALDITNLGIVDFTADAIETLEITLSSYSDYIDVSTLLDGSKKILLLDNTGATVSTGLSYSYDAAENKIVIDMSPLNYITVAAGEKLTVSFDLSAKTEFTTAEFTTPTATDYFYIAIKTNITLNAASVVSPLEMVSDKVFIAPATAITTTINGGTTPIDNTGAEIVIPIETTLTSSDKAGFTRDGEMVIALPSGFDFVDSSLAIEIDGTAKTPLVDGADYTISTNDNGTADTADDYTEITLLNLTQTNSVKVSYQVSYTGADGEFAISIGYKSNIIENGNIYSNIYIDRLESFDIVTP